MKIKDIIKNLKGLHPNEKLFRIIVSKMIIEDVNTFYTKKKYCNYLNSLGIDDGSTLFIWLLDRRDEYLENTKDLILKQLRVI